MTQIEEDKGNNHLKGPSARSQSPGTLGLLSKLRTSTYAPIFNSWQGIIDNDILVAEEKEVKSKALKVDASLARPRDVRMDDGIQLRWLKALRSAESARKKHNQAEEELAAMQGIGPGRSLGIEYVERVFKLGLKLAAHNHLEEMRAIAT